MKTGFFGRAAFVVGTAWLATGCGNSGVSEPERSALSSGSATTASSTSVATLSAKLSRPAPERLVAIGDLHGDLDHARRVLRLAGVIDDKDHWIGGHTVVVQTGDAIDRGDDDRAILDLFDALKKDAKEAGGEVIPLLGNHEIMNSALDFRYVMPSAYAAFEAPNGATEVPARAARLPAEARGRATAFAPGGHYALVESERPIMIKVGDTVLVHGGILPKHVAYGLDKMNDELDQWLEKKADHPPAALVAEDGPVWTRAYSDGPSPPCDVLKTALAALGAKRMVVGHTVQKSGINAACDGAVYRVDVGLARFFGGPIEALEIRGDNITVLREPVAH